MSEATTEAPASAEAEGQETKSDQSFTQADVDRIVADRLKRERDKIGDVKALRAAADELAVIKESQKTEAQKNADRLAQLEAEAKADRREALKFKVAAKFSISEEDADLFLTGDDEDAMTKQAKRLTDRESERKKQGNYSPREGTSSTSLESGDERETVRALFGS